MGLKYTVGESSAQEIYFHLKECGRDFVSSLEEKVSLRSYCGKIRRKAVTLEAWDADTLVGLIAAYFNDPDGEIGYITNVSVIKALEGKGIASCLVGLCIDYAREYGFNTIHLEVKRSNTRAISLYNRFRFVVRETDDLEIMQMELDIS